MYEKVYQYKKGKSQITKIKVIIANGKAPS